MMEIMCLLASFVVIYILQDKEFCWNDNRMGKGLNEKY